MVTSVASRNRGIRDWLMQRVTSIIFVIYTLGLLGFFITTPEVNYENWHTLFSYNWMKVATILVLLSIMLHAWVGIWTVLTDYIKITWLRFMLNVLVVVALVAFFFDGLLILWGV